jgi:hypothetical protein
MHSRIVDCQHTEPLTSIAETNLVTGTDRVAIDVAHRYAFVDSSSLP